MREDMFKVIVERPRTGGSFSKKGRFDAGNPDEDSPAREALHKFRRTKWLNENLSPLERYLHSQVGRPWDRVYSEICERIDRRSTVQQHIHQHIGDFVAMQVSRVGGELVYQWRYGPPRPLAGRGAPALYVDPRTRLLRTNGAMEKARMSAWAEYYAKRDAPPADRRRVAPGIELQRIGGVWYEVRLESDPSGKAESTFKVLPAPQPARHSRASCHAEVARAKRQLGRAELKRLGLANED